MAKSNHPIFIKSVISLVGVLIISASLYIRGGQNKTKFQHITGKVTYLEKSFEHYPNRDLGKYRYMQLDTYNKVFELFIGKDAGDFKPDLEKIDALKTGDEVTVYFDDSANSENDIINRVTYFIDKGEEPVFIKGAWDKVLACVIGGLCIATLALVFVLKRMGKIA